MSDGARRTALAWSVSIAAHAAVIAVMLMVIQVVIPSDDDAPIVTVRFDDPGLAPPERPTESPTAKPVEAPPPQIVTQEPPPAPDIKALDAAMPEALTPAPTFDSAPPPPILVAAPPEVRFAGIGAGNARDIVYVVDGSGSMISAMPIVIEELTKSLRKLEAVQSFQIVFFQNDGYVSFTHPDFANTAVPVTRMVPARRPYIESAIKWTSGVKPRGRSNPIEALEVALALQPDAIFFLTTDITGADAWTPEQREAFFSRLESLDPLARNGVRRVTIKTILFLDDDKSGIVREIAERFGGDNGFIQRSREDLGL